jgi:hypothetical protein
MGAQSRCYACEIDRDSIGVATIADGYDLRTFKCSGCGSILKLVARKPQGQPSPATFAGPIHQ